METKHRTSEFAGDDVGKYRVLLELGQGGTAHVYLAVARGPGGFNKLVVLKALKRAFATDDEHRLMFMDEARLSARLNHPNVVAVNEIIEQDGVPIIVMEYLEGRALSDFALKLPDVTREMSLKVLCEVLEGLHYSHELADYDGSPLNVVHRDVTPHNVFVTYDGRVRVLDFGIAKLNGSQVETQTGVIKGKLRYMPPEQITGEQLDRRVDLYAVGVMLWEVVTRQRMWRGLSEANIMNRVLNDEIPTPSSVATDVDPELEAIVMKALAPEPDDRYSTAKELQSDIESYLGQKGFNVSVRDVGSVIAGAFEASREHTRKVIEAELSKATLTAPAADAVVFPTEGVNALTITSLTGSQTQGATSTGSQTITNSQRGSYAGLLVGGLILGIIGTVAVTHYLLQPPEAVAEAPAPSAAASVAAAPAPKPEPDADASAESVPAAPAPPATVHLQVTAFPGTAKVEVDGKEQTGNPMSLDLPRGDARHTVRVTAKGYKPFEQSIGASRDRDMVVRLEALPRAHVPRRPRPKPRAKADCDPPYVYRNGIKEYKPNCF